MRCARTVRQVGYLRPVFPHGQDMAMTAVTTVFSDTELHRFLLSPKTQMMNENKPCFTLKRPDCWSECCFCPVGGAPPVVAFRVVTEMLTC